MLNFFTFDSERDYVILPFVSQNSGTLFTNQLIIFKSLDLFLHLVKCLYSEGAEGSTVACAVFLTGK